MSDNDAGNPAATDPTNASAPVPALGDGLPLSADERVVAAETVPDFEVPAPPTFDAAPAIPDATVEVPPVSIPDAPEPFAAAAAAEGAATRRAVRSADAQRSPAPPPPGFSDPALPQYGVQTVSPTPVSETAEEAAGRASDESWAKLSSFDGANQDPEPAPNSYRGWTVAIFGGLAALLIGAIALLGYLASNATLGLPDFGDDDTTQSSARGATDDAPVPVAATDTCSAHCAHVASLVGEEVVGANDAVLWSIATPWQTVATQEFGSQEKASATYSSDQGTVSATVWAYPDDPAAAAGLSLLMQQWGEPVESDSVYEGGEGVRHSYADGTTSRVLWYVDGDKGEPWVMLLEGPDQEDAVMEFYLAMPI